MPLALSASLEKEGAILSAQGTVGWGLVAIHLAWEKDSGIMSLTLKGRRVMERPIRTPIDKSGTFRGEVRIFSKVREVDLTPLGGWVHKLIGLFVLITRHLKKGSLSCSLNLGFPKAWMTGTVYGYYRVVKSILWPISWLSLHMMPYFDGPKCDGEIELSVEVRYPLVLVFRVFQVLGMRSLLQLVTPGRGR
ncbi:MAG: hypothetical protein LUO82_01195 [Methanomicrobiales archaeon]|nr:hypothetical protein [Methanomicrobiales archaeon]